MRHTGLGRVLRAAGVLAAVTFSCGAPHESNAPAPVRMDERCTAPRDQTSECDALLYVWAYDRARDRCYEYSYGGCPSGSALNRFASKGECERSCRAGLTQARQRRVAPASARLHAVHPESLIVLGDTQHTSPFERLLLREDNREPQRALLRQLTADSDAIAPAFIVHLGDSVTQGDSAEQWREYDALIAPLRERGLRVRAVLGNHDYWGDDALALALARRTYPELAERTYFSDSHRGVGLLWLDSGGPDGALSAQLRWLGERLDQFEKDESVHAVLAFTHHPARTNAVGRSGDERVAHMRKELERSPKFRALFSGHVHGYEHHEARGRHFVVSGGAGGPRVDYRGRSPYARNDHARFTLNRRIGPLHRSPMHYLILDWPELGAGAGTAPTPPRTTSGLETTPAPIPRITVTARCLEQSDGCETGVLDRFQIELAPRDPPQQTRPRDD